jgi:hypothetical protein
MYQKDYCENTNATRDVRICVDTYQWELDKHTTQKAVVNGTANACMKHRYSENVGKVFVRPCSVKPSVEKT